jgi:hypothetical protein
MKVVRPDKERSFEQELTKASTWAQPSRRSSPRLPFNPSLSEFFASLREIFVCLVVAMPLCVLLCGSDQSADLVHIFRCGRLINDQVQVRASIAVGMISRSSVPSPRIRCRASRPAMSKPQARRMAGF